MSPSTTARNQAHGISLLSTQSASRALQRLTAEHYPHPTETRSKARDRLTVPTHDEASGMDQRQVQTFADLLERSLNRAAVKHDSRDERMSLGAYRDNLRRSWATHGADLNLLLITRYQPLIEDATLRRELIQVVTAELAPHIHEDTIQTASIAVTGGPGPGFPLEDLIRHILNVAIVRGPRYAAEAFYRCVEQSVATYQFFGLLAGVRVDQELQISPGISLVPIPNSSNELPAHLPLWPYWNPMDLMGRTLIAVEHNISPLFINPRLTAMDPWAPFQDSAVSAEYPDFHIARFCQALSLAADAPIVCSAIWTYIDPAEIFNVWDTYRGNSATYFPDLARRSGSVNVAQDDISNALAIYEAMEALPPSIATKLRVPVDRWIKSKADQSRVDTAIDLGIALESLYLEDIGNNPELGFRLRLRAAWYLAEDQTGRRNIMKNLGDVYGLRSKAVHTGDIGSHHDTTEPLKEGQRLCRQSIVKVIQSGRFPDWNALVLGEAYTEQG